MSAVSMAQLLYPIYPYTKRLHRYTHQVIVWK